MRKTLCAFIALLLFLSLGVLAGCNNVDLPGTVQDSFQSSQLSKYAIIYAEDSPEYYDLADKLSGRILETYGIAVPVKLDIVSNPTQYEIVLGDTNRTDAQGSIMEYSVTVQDGKFFINVGGVFSAEAAIGYLCQNVFTGKELTLTNGTYYKKSLLTRAYTVTPGTTARVMTANVLADAFGDSNYKKAYYRAEIFAGMLLASTPDVVGLQETDENWNAVLDAYLVKLQKNHGITYSRVLATYDGKTNYTSLLYRSDKYKVEDSGVKVFSWWTDKNFHHSFHMRNVSWVRFSSLENGSKPFIVANTHWSYRTEHADGTKYLYGSTKPIASDELRVQCKNETDAFLSTLKQANPQIPIFLTGDFNTSVTYFTQSGWTPTSFSVISEEAKRNGAALSTVPTSGHFDHLFGTGSYTIKRYEFLKGINHLDLLTDHPFAYADLTF